MPFVSQRECPYCKRAARSDATVCPHCTREIPVVPGRVSPYLVVALIGVGLLIGAYVLVNR